MAQTLPNKDGKSAVEASETDSVQSVQEQLSPTDPDVMYHVMAAEMLGTEGDFSAAAAEYLKAALASSDPGISERASRVAVSADEWAMVVLASDRWALLEPTSLDAHRLAAGARLREGDYVGAEYQLAKILELTESDPATGWNMVTSLLAAANDAIRASKVLNNLLQDFDAESNVDSLRARSQLAAHSGDLDRAVELADAAVKNAPGRADLLAWSGRLAVNQNNQAVALKRYQQAWELDREDSAIAMAYAELLKRSNQVAVAQDVLAQLPDTPDTRFARIVFALDVKQAQTAQVLYKGFYAVQYVNVSEAAFHAAQSAELLGLLQEAIDWYGKVTGERALRAGMRRAYLFADLGEIEQARNILAQFRIQTDKATRSQSYQVEAQILQNADLNNEAMDVLTDALSALPEDTGLRYTRALVAVNLMQIELAERDLRQIIMVQPDNAAALNALGYTLADLTDRYAEAENLIFQAFALQPEDPSIIDSMGWISYRLDRLDEAEKYLRQAWLLLRNAEVAAHLGEVLWAKGQKNEASSLWQLGTQLDSDNEILIKTMKRFGERP